MTAIIAELERTPKAGKSQVTRLRRSTERWTAR